jgi:hypothetical protein
MCDFYNEKFDKKNIRIRKLMADPSGIVLTFLSEQEGGVT